jgi:hypothetical protein
MATIDATPLFLMLAAEYVAWTDDLNLIRELEPNLMAALRWIDSDGDSDVGGKSKITEKGEIKFATSEGNVVSYDRSLIIGGPKEDGNIGRIS